MAEEGRPARRAAVYARVSTTDQSAAGQLERLVRFAEASEWRALPPFVDEGISGAKDRRPALDALLAAARRRAVDVVVVTKLDRLARSVHHLVTLALEFQTLGVDLVVIDQAIDSRTATGRLLFHVLAAIAEFERELIRERVRAGVARAKRLGKHCGRPRLVRVDVDAAAALRAQGLGFKAIARQLGGIHPMQVRRALATLEVLPAA